MRPCPRVKLHRRRARGNVPGGNYKAKTWRDAAAFNAAIIGEAFAAGYFAEPSAKWEDGLDGENGCRLVSVFVAAADYMTDDGHAVA